MSFSRWLEGLRRGRQTEQKIQAQETQKQEARAQDALERAREAAGREAARYLELFGTDITYTPENEAERLFWKQCATLPEQVRACLVYDLARKNPPMGHGAPYGFRLMGTLGPFWSHGWAQTEPVPGVAFGIGRACFAGRDPLLFYAYDMRVPAGLPLEEAETDGPAWMARLYETIEGYSSGIRLEGLRGRVIRFRLEEKNVRKLEILISSQEQPDYVFTWPGAGEFSCTLGEIVDGKMIPLYLDDFIMK